MLRMGLPKGSIKKKSLELIEKLCREPVDSKSLHFNLGDLEIFLLKHRDIPILIDNGQLDIGITGLEWVVERKSSVSIAAVLNWCDTRISVIQSEDAEEEPKTCVTEYFEIADSYFKKEGRNVKVNLISGSSESLVPSMYDCCVDCVETGTTLKHNKLKEKQVIMRSKTVLIYREKTDEIDALLERIIPYLTEK